MDKLIRALEISDQSISLGLRMQSRPQAAVEVLRPPVQVLAARQQEETVLPDFHFRRQAEEYAARLEIERENIREELKRELDARVESALQESRSQGLKEGLELAKAEAQREAERQHEAVTQTLATVAEVAERQIAGAEDAIVGIAFESVCKILGREAVNRKVSAPWCSRCWPASARRRGPGASPSGTAPCRNEARRLSPEGTGA
jgi:flagellar biosynthesis/type III secretory pathway protein FliH